MFGRRLANSSRAAAAVGATTGRRPSRCSARANGSAIDGSSSTSSTTGRSGGVDIALNRSQRIDGPTRLSEALPALARELPGGFA
jgi:hypothetical protein